MPSSRRTNALDDSQAALRMLLAELEELASPDSPVLVRTWTLDRAPAAWAPVRAPHDRNSGNDAA